MTESPLSMDPLNSDRKVLKTDDLTVSNLRQSIQLVNQENFDLKKYLHDAQNEVDKSNILLCDIKEERQNLINKLIETEQRAQKALCVSEQ